MLMHVVACSLLLLLYSSLLYDYTTFCLSVLQSVDIWVVATVFTIIKDISMNILKLVLGTFVSFCGAYFWK
jgi:hypothetical protein